MALFYDAGKVAPRFDALSWKRLSSDVGIGVRFHGPLATPLRIELAKGQEGLRLVFAGERGILTTRIPDIARSARRRRTACSPASRPAASPVDAPSGASRKFFDDDPLVREPETQDASKVAEWDIDLVFDLADNLFGRPGDPTPDVRARNVNTIDEVPDSSWFTNRILARPLSAERGRRAAR